MSKEIDYIDFRPISALENFHFVVKDYQRGYKWEEQQIRDLLDDINNHEEGKYCLQPLLVHHDKGEIELIDGQQRVTSIFLILYFLQKQQFYTVNYQTRPKTKEFLDKEFALLDKYVSSDWKEFKEENKSFDNADIYFLFKVYKEIKKWFDENPSKREGFSDKLKNKVHVIWYNTFESSTNGNIISPETVFLNLNAGKIPLTNSELIKALFILDIQNSFSGEIGKLKAFDLASDWDRIENQLHSDTFWSFICDNDYYDNLDTRIDLIIDIANQIQKIDSDESKKASYRKYDKQFQEGKKLDWQAIKQTFNKIEEWYCDKELYHYIGFLIVTKYEKLGSIVELSKGKTKDKFKKNLIEKIQLKFSETKNEDNNLIVYHSIENLHYEKFRSACQNVLLLLNIQDYLNRSSDEKFPFDLYIKEKWSVEHINPQNPRGFKTIREVIDWLNSYKRYFMGKPDSEMNAVGDKINQVLDFFINKDLDIKFSDHRFKDQSDRDSYIEVIEKITELLSLHEIGNLCLLDRNTNSKLGNKVFKEKRQEIIEIYFQKDSKADKTFVPNCTKDVFAKVFSKNIDSITDKIFGLDDMEEYKKHIDNQLRNYFPNKV